MNKSPINNLSAERVYLYEVRVLRYLHGLEDGKASRADLTRKMLTNIDKATRDAILDDMVGRRLIWSTLTYHDPEGTRRPRTYYGLLARGRALYRRHYQRCKSGEMRRIIPGAKP